MKHEVTIGATVPGPKAWAVSERVSVTETLRVGTCTTISSNVDVQVAV
ncbi:hypothetical protein [Nocardia sp. NPDC058497]